MVSSISRHRDTHLSSSFNGKSIFQGAVGYNDLVLWCSQWCVKCNSHSYSRTSSGWRWSSFFPKRWKPLHSFAKITFLTWTYVVFDKVGLSWNFQWDEANDVLHMVVDMYQVLNPYSAGCWVSEVALLPSQEGDKAKPSLKAYSKLESI